MPGRGGFLELPLSPSRPLLFASSVVIRCWVASNIFAGKRMLIDFHRLIGLGVVKLNFPRFDSQLQLLPEHLALICIV
jgi:hypothetical protein